MPNVSKKQQACVNRYMSAHYDRINITVPKGDRERYREHSKEHGYNSLNDFVVKSMENQMERDNAGESGEQ